MPSTSTIRRILHAHGLITPTPAKRPRSSYRRFQAELPNECWQPDITHLPLTGGRRLEVLDFLDDHSRYLLHLGCTSPYTGARVATVMNELISAYGVPYSTLTDNGLVFTARLARHKGARNGFEKLLQAHQIHQKNGAPGHPPPDPGQDRTLPPDPQALVHRPSPGPHTRGPAGDAGGVPHLVQP